MYMEIQTVLIHNSSTLLKSKCISSESTSHPLHLGLLYSGDLLRHNRQHLHINTIKLIKACPGPGAAEKADRQEGIHECD